MRMTYKWWVYGSKIANQSMNLRDTKPYLKKSHIIVDNSYRPRSNLLNLQIWLV